MTLFTRSSPIQKAWPRNLFKASMTLFCSQFCAVKSLQDSMTWFCSHSFTAVATHASHDQGKVAGMSRELAVSLQVMYMKYCWYLGSTDQTQSQDKVSGHGQEIMNSSSGQRVRHRKVGGAYNTFPRRRADHFYDRASHP